MSWWFSGCCTRQCVVCDGAPEEFVADFGAGGWTDFLWGICDEFTGEITLTQISTDPDACLYDFICNPNHDEEIYRLDNACCAWEGPITGDWPKLYIYESSPSKWRYELVICLAENCWWGQAGESWAIYKSDEWSDGDCLYGADPGTGKITLTKVSDQHNSYDCGNPCLGALPATVDIWAA